MDINRTFKLFDIRGNYPEEVDERLAFIVASAVNDLYKPARVLLAADSRASSPKLKAFLADGFADSAAVFDLGSAAIPQFYFSACTLGFDLGVMVTASHLGGTQNGFKIVGRGGLPLDEGEMIRLKSLCQKWPQSPIVRPRHAVSGIETTEEYVRVLKNFIRLGPEVPKICCDFNLSAAESVLRRIFEDFKIPITVVPPRSTPGNPLLLTTRRELAGLIKTTHADLGIIWDSDADRVILVDERGNLIPPTYVLAILGRYLIGKEKIKKVVVDVRAGLVVRDVIEEAGGKIIVVPAWHQFIQFAMVKDPDIVFGGETTGHIFFRDFYTIDDGIAAAFKFIEAISLAENREILKRIKKRYFEVPETNFPCSAEKSVLVLSQLTDYYRKQEFMVSLVDGVTVFGPNWKFNLRQSASESLLRLNIEAQSSGEAEKIYEQINKMV